MPAITHSYPPGRQRGAVLMVMLIIMVIGAITILVSSLNSSALKNARDQTTADALAKAKDALIGYAVGNSTYPGGLPCPDTGNVGTADAFAANNHCPNYVGRLPWKTLGLPDLRDGEGERLWYALSPTLRNNPSAQPLNSDTPGQFNITGIMTANNVVAIVFSPQAALSSLNQVRDTANSNAAANYLEGSNATNGAVINADINGGAYTSASTYTFTINSPGAAFNDQAIIVAHDQLFAPVEMRIAREARNCMDSYAASSANKYPWAAPVSDPAFSSTDNTFFGRVPVSPATTGGALTPTILALLAQQALLNNVIGALAAYVANPNAANTSSLLNAALNLINSATNPLTSSVNGTVDNAGDRARDLANGSGVSLATVNTAISNANTALNNALTANGYSPSTPDPAMQAAWPAACLFTSSYWLSWRELVFFQIAVGYEPNSSANCTASTCLAINGSGNTAGGNGTYHAAVLVARKPINGQVRSLSNTATYLEGSNVNPGATTPPTFETYGLSDPGYSNVNDLVLCLDGKVNCI